MAQKENFSTTCSDGVVLKGLLIIPERPKAIVQFNGGTGAKKEFYLAFLEYLAGHNYVCCLWDYRGSGESAPTDLSTCTYTFSDYGLKDMPTIKNYLTARFPGLPFFLFGHSVGGQQVGFMDNLEGVKGLVGFAVSVGYLPYMPLRQRLLSNYFFYIFTPLIIALKGYVQAKRFGYMEDLPRNVVKEWRDWCSKPTYFFDKKFYGKTVPQGHFQDYQFPVHIFWSTDDSIANKRSIPAFWNQIKSTKGVEFTRLIPEEIPTKKLDHFGFFRKKFRDTLWPRAVAKLDEFLDTSSIKNPPLSSN